MGCRWCTLFAIVVELLVMDQSFNGEAICHVRNFWLLCWFDWEWETKPFLGFGVHDFCKTFPCFIQMSSQFEVTTQALSFLSILFASLLVILRVWAKHPRSSYPSSNGAHSGTHSGKKTRLSSQLRLFFGSQMPLRSFMACIYFFVYPVYGSSESIFQL